jgi:3D (Asp-Asp-Asp) domain-containing protein
LYKHSVKIEYITVEGTKTQRHITRAPEAGTSVAEHPEDFRDTDVVLTPGEEPLGNGHKIRVERPVERKADIAGQKKTLLLYPGSVQENLKRNDIQITSDDVVKPALDKQVAADTRIVVRKVTFKVKTKDEVIPARDVLTLDPSLPSGQLRSTEGHDGKARYTYTTTYVNGKKKKTKKELTKWLRKAKDNKVRLGTSITGENGKVTYARIFTANATAYYAGKNAHGATGQACHYGTCAVDPRVIPYGTKLWVEGYGTAVANDCGGAVKGNIIDLYMHSTKECYSWGRRNVKTYVLE